MANSTPVLLAFYAFCQATPVDDSANKKDPILKQPVYQYVKDVQPGNLIFSLGKVLPKRLIYIIPCKSKDDACLSLDMAGRITPPSETCLIHVDWPIYFM